MRVERPEVDLSVFDECYVKGNRHVCRQQRHQQEGPDICQAQYVVGGLSARKVNAKVEADDDGKLNLCLHEPERRVAAIFKPVVDEQQNPPPRVVADCHFLLVLVPDWAHVQGGSDAPVNQQNHEVKWVQSGHSTA